MNCDPAENPAGSEDDREIRRLRYVNSSIPNAANSRTPPTEPTIAGTRGTMLDGGVAGAVDDGPGPLIIVGLPPGGGINAKDDVALADVLLNEDPLNEAEILIDEPLNELADDDPFEKMLLVVEFKRVVVAVVGKDEVRFAGRLVTILVEDVAKVDAVVMLADTDEVIRALVVVDTTVEF